MIGIKTALIVVVLVRSYSRMMGAGVTPVWWTGG
jgi:hypothetical protein